MAPPPPLRTRVSEMLGIDYPIVQAPMGFIARAQLASAVSEAGALGIVETSSGRLDEVREEMVMMRERTTRPWGVNIAQLFVRDHGIVDFVAEQGVRFVTTSAGDPTRYTKALHDAGITVFHVVPSLRAALKAVDAGVDGLVVEGGEGGGFKSTRPVSTVVLLPQVCAAVDVPVIAAGGIVDGPSMAAAFALGAEGVQMGTRMVAAAESPVHDAYKQLIVGRRRHRHRDALGPPQPGVPGDAHALQRGARAGGLGGHGVDVRHRGAARRSTSTATSRPRSRSAARSPGASTTWRPWPTSSTARSPGSTTRCAPSTGSSRDERDLG